jgi:hypothetical protein
MADEQTDGTTEVAESTEAAEAAETVQTEEQTQAQDPQDAPKTWTVKSVNGKDMIMTEEELINNARKAAAADEVMRNNAAERKALDAEKKMWDDLAAAQAGDLNALKRLPSYPKLNVSQEHVSNVIAELEQAQKGTDVSDPNAATPVQRPAELEDLPDEVQQTVRDAQRAKDEKVLADIYKQVESSVTGDKILKTVTNDKRKKHLANYTMGVVQRIAQESGTFNQAMIQQAVQETRQHAEDIGLLIDEADSASGVFPALGRSSDSLSASAMARASEPPKRIPVEQALNTDDYAANVLRRMQYDQLKNRSRTDE